MQLLRLGAICLFVGIVGMFLLTTLVFAVFSIDLPDSDKLVRRQGYSTVIYDRSGKVLYDVFNKENRIPLKLKDIPKYLQEATVAIEDREFYSHQGLSFSGIVRSAISILTLQGISGGGSTITQQVVKNVLLSPEQSVFRKIREVILANQIEKKYTKEEILQLYLNEAPYGGATYGVESAARTYFDKSAKDLNLVESAVIAGLTQSPTTYSPYGAHPTAYIERTKAVLRRMREDGYITAQQETDSVKQLPSLKFSSDDTGIKAPHFVFYVKDELVERFGEEMVESGGLRVTTTLDWQLEEEVEKIVKAEVEKIKNLKASNGAVIVLNPKTGEILGMTGSYDYFDKEFGSFNVTTALRQPGSSGKPFIFAQALSKGYTAGSMLVDAKTDYPLNDPSNKDKMYSPANYDLKYRGPQQLRFSLGNSTNTVAVKLTALVGLRDIMALGYDAGISSWKPTEENVRDVGLSLALGGREVKLLELTSAYGAFANSGVHTDPVAILKVTDSKDRVLYEWRPSEGKRVLSPEVSFIISHILSDNNARKDVFGEVNMLQIPGHTVAVKTGTTDQKRDNWTIGYTPSVVVGTWVGNNDNTVMAPALSSGVTGAAPIWNKVIKLALKGKSAEEFKKPESVLPVSVDSLLGGLPHGSDPTRTEYFIKGTEPTAVSPMYKKIKVSKSNGKLANEVEIKSGDFEDKEFIVLTESDPISTDGKNRWQEAINKWIEDNKKDDGKYHPPTEKSDANQNSVKVQIEAPSDHSRVNSSEVTVKAKAFAAREIVKIVVELDGEEKYNKASDNIEEKITGLTNGNHTIKVKAIDAGGNEGTAEARFGINEDWKD